MLFRQDLKQTISQRIDPKLIMANQILQLTSMELEQAIEQELAENPALEVPEEDPCEGCDVPKSLCIDCQFRKYKTAEEMDISIHELEGGSAEYNQEPDEETDFISSIVADVSLQDHLRALYHGVAPEELFRVGEYLISNIDDNGYLTCKLEEAVMESGCSLEEAEAALGLIQSLDPPGVGARDLRECLRLQLEHLNNEGCGNPIALKIVKDYWDDMVSHNVGRIARRLKVSQQAVTSAIEYIRTRLNPYPGNSFREPWQHKLDNTGSTVKPDVIIKRTPAGYEIEVVGFEQYALSVNSYYRQMYEDLKNGTGRNYSPEEKKHISEFVERADLFIKNINQRRRTLRAIAKAIVDIQQGYLETGSKSFMRPLTRTKLAKILNMHESTVSRATANKYVQLPSQEVVSFDFFFDGSSSIKDLIHELISNEDSRNPLSDQQIAEILQERGYDVARRTVVKYREAMKILSSRQRRR